MVDNAAPQQLGKDGQAAYQRGDYRGAARLFEASCAAYREAGDALNAAEMANNACVAHLQSEDPGAALQVVEGSAEVFAAAGDLRRQGMALGNRASALEHLERNEEAVQAYLLASQVLEQAGEDQLRAQVMQSLSMLQLEMGRQLQALVSMHQGVEGVQRPNAKQRLVKQLLKIPLDMLRKK
ncbi:MAG: hypothetical protein ACKOC5_11200 [Chloroflexota bacterium]